MEDDEFNYEESLRKREAADKNMETVAEDTKAWLDTDEKVKAYFERFAKFWSESFIKDYPSVKARFMRYADELGDLPEHYQLRYLEIASERLMDIQRKKLFDIVCQWDANLITIEDIEISWDFYPWQKKLLHCPFITPVTGEEVELYMKYVDTNHFDQDGSIELVDYWSIRDTSDDGIMPEWIAFENNHSGNNKYLLLPMTRTEKEEFYRSLCIDEKNAKEEEQYQNGTAERPKHDDRPHISIHTYRDVEEFIIENESKEVLASFRKYYAHATDQLVRDNPKDQEEGWLREKVTDIFFHLKDIKEKIPVAANDDWRRGLIQAFNDYEKQNIKAAMLYAFSDYQMKRDLNIKESKKKYEDSSYEWAHNVRNQILRGRELNGEPRDFNF